LARGSLAGWPGGELALSLRRCGAAELSLREGAELDPRASFQLNCAQSAVVIRARPEVEPRGAGHLSGWALWGGFGGGLGPGGVGAQQRALAE